MSEHLTSDIIHHPPPPPGGRGWGGDGSDDGRGAFRRASFAGLLVLVAITAMVFAAFLTAFIVRRQETLNWQPIPKPPILLVNTGVLLASSLLLDVSRRALKHRNRIQFNWWWSLATAMGILFLLGQAEAWRELGHRGIFVASSPSSSFFYLFTAAHAVHLLGGVSALIYVDVQALRLQLGPAKRTAIDIAAIYWHFLDVVWLLLMLLFYVWG
jgi:cytochrome c oxidase subunit III